MIETPDSQVDTPSHDPETNGDNDPGIDPGTPATTAASPATTAAAAGLQDDGISLDEAARRLGLSERSVRRLIKAGELAAQKQASPRGDVWRVYLDSSMPGVTAEDALQASDNPRADSGSRATTAAENATTAAGADTEARREPSTPPPSAAGPESRPEMLKALDVIDELRRDNQKLVDMNTQLAGQVGYLQRQVHDQQETIQRLLMAPREELADVTPSDAPAPGESGPDWQALAQALEERVKRLEAPPAASERVSWWRRLFS